MTDRLLPIEVVIDKIGLKRAKIYSMIAKGDFPAPIKIGAASRWRESVVDAWIDRQKREFSKNLVSAT